MNIAIYGAGGHGRVVLDIINRAAVHRPMYFGDSTVALVGKVVDAMLVRGNVETMAELRNNGEIQGAVVAVGDNVARVDLAGQLNVAKLELISAVHPAAHVAWNVHMGRNVVVCAGAIISAHAHIGNHVIVNTGAIIDHECRIGDGAHVCPGARLAGKVRVGRKAFIGIGATVIQGVSIGDNAIVGAGAVVLRDVEAGKVVKGVPAK